MRNPAAVEERESFGDRETRVARNELMFRRVNERIQDLGKDWGETIELVCECGDPDCFDWVDLPKHEVENVARDRDRFVVLPGHELVDVERVVERHDGYVLVEKPDDAVELAEGR